MTNESKINPFTDDDHYEKLVHHQTLKSASENWNDLKEGPLEFGPLLESLKPFLEKGEK